MTEDLTVGAEVFHETAEGDGSGSATKMNIGVIWAWNKTRHLLASAGPTIRGRSGYQAYLAIQFTVGPDK